MPIASLLNIRKVKGNRNCHTYPWGRSEADLTAERISLQIVCQCRSLNQLYPNFSPYRVALLRALCLVALVFRLFGPCPFSPGQCNFLTFSEVAAFPLGFCRLGQLKVELKCLVTRSQKGLAARYTPLWGLIKELNKEILPHSISEGEFDIKFRRKIIM